MNSFRPKPVEGYVSQTFGTVGWFRCKDFSQTSYFSDRTGVKKLA